MTITEQQEEQAQEVAICKLEARARNYQEVYNGFPSGSVEFVCADFFMEGYDEAKRGDSLLEGRNECFKRGYKAYKPVIGS